MVPLYVILSRTLQLSGILRLHPRVDAWVGGSVRRPGYVVWTGKEGGEGVLATSSKPLP